MAELDTISTAIKAAESGHLVMATIHTEGAAQTIDRIIDMFPFEHQSLVRLQLSQVMIAILSQRLLPRTEGKGRVAAFEVMIANREIRDLIREGKTSDIPEVMQFNTDGMQTMEQALAEMVKKKVEDFLYEKETYEIRGACFAVWKQLGSVYKESIYHKALAKELKERKISFENEKSIDVVYKGEKVGTYRPDFIVASAVIVEIKAAPFVGKEDEKRFWHYLRGSKYRLGLLINLGGKKLEIKRLVYDTARAKYQR